MRVLHVCLQDKDFRLSIAVAAEQQWKEIKLIVAVTKTIKSKSD